MTPLLEPIAAQDIVIIKEVPSPAKVSPLPWMAAALGVGVGLARLGLAPELGLWIGALVALASWIAALRWSRGTWLLFALILACFVLGGWRGHSSLERPGEPLPEAERIAVVRILTPVREGGGRRHALASIERWQRGASPALTPPEVARQVWLKLPDSAEVSVGARLVGRLNLRPPRSTAYPGAFDEATMLEVFDADGTASARRGLLPLAENPLSWLEGIRAALDKHRQEVLRLLEARGAESGLLSAIALGQGRAVAEGPRRVFAASGLAHVLAVSGLHFGLVALAVFFLARVVALRLGRVTRRWGAQRIAAFASIPPLALYVVYVGAPVSAQRAFIMATCLFLGRALHREGHPALSLSVAAIVLLLWRPVELMSPGFQLSFSAVVGLLWTADAYERPVAEWVRTNTPRWVAAPLAWCLSALIATLGASVATAPLVLWHFGQAPLLGMIANLWVVPVVSYALLPLGLVVILSTGLSTEVATFAVGCAAWCERWLVQSVDAFVGLDAGIALDAPTLPGGLLLALGVFAVGALRAPGRRWAQLLASVSLAVVVAWWSWHATTPPHEGSLRVTFIPVGQGDATLIETPDGRAMLIDAGGSRHGDPGADIVTPFLHAIGRDRLDWVVLTHADLDHFGGLQSVIQTFRPREVWTNGQHDDNARYRAFLASIEAVGARHREVNAATPRLALGDGAVLTVIWPDRLDPARGKNANSVTMRLDHRDVSFMLPGDLEAGGEAALLQRGVPLGATVLKAGHHGSLTSSSEAFLDAVQPNFNVYSVGKHNRFGLPHPDVVDRYARRGIESFRTDEDGAVRMTSDGEALTIETWRDERGAQEAR